MIKNIVFDIGGVLIGYRWENMLKDYGLDEESASRVGLEIFNDPLWREFDRGTILMDGLISEYKCKYPGDADHIEYFIRNCELIKVNRPETWEKVEKLRTKGYKIYLLSNYSEELLKLHVDDMELFNTADGKIISYEVNSIKPEPEIYNALFEKYDLNPEECLFFDDRQDNVDGSEAMGMKGLKVDSKEHINQMLDELFSYGSINNIPY